MSQDKEFNSAKFFKKFVLQFQKQNTAQSVGIASLSGTQQTEQIAQNYRNIGAASQSVEDGNQAGAIMAGQKAQKAAEKARANSEAATAFGGKASVDMSTQNLFNFSG